MGAKNRLLNGDGPGEREHALKVQVRTQERVADPQLTDPAFHRGVPAQETHRRRLGSELGQHHHLLHTGFGCGLGKPELLRLSVLRRGRNHVGPVGPGQSGGKRVRVVEVGDDHRYSRRVESRSVALPPHHHPDRYDFNAEGKHIGDLVAAVVSASGTSDDPPGYGETVARALFPDVLSYVVRNAGDPYGFAVRNGRTLAATHPK